MAADPGHAHYRIGLDALALRGGASAAGVDLVGSRVLHARVPVGRAQLRRPIDLRRRAHKPRQGGWPARVATDGDAASAYTAARGLTARARDARRHAATTISAPLGHMSRGWYGPCPAWPGCLMFLECDKSCLATGHCKSYPWRPANPCSGMGPLHAASCHPPPGSKAAASTSTPRHPPTTSPLARTAPLAGSAAVSPHAATPSPWYPTRIRGSLQWSPALPLPVRTAAAMSPGCCG